MKTRTVALAAVFLGVGLLLGAVIGRATTQMALMSGRVTGFFDERFITHEGIEGESGRTVEIQVPRIPDESRQRSLPPIRTPPDLSSRIVVHPIRGFFAVARAVIRATVNLLALVLIIIGVIMIVRKRNQPAEKVPPAVVIDTE
jgi:hypothetical protein